MHRIIKQYLPYLFIGIVFYLLDRENLFINDDLNYAMNHVTGEPVRNLWDAIQSQGYDWFHQNGRFIIHTLVQCFCGFLGLELFWVCNTIVFLLWLKGIVSYMKLILGMPIKPLGVVLLGTVLMVPAWGITNLGYISGAVNYLWAGCAYMWFVILYMKAKENKAQVGLAYGLFLAAVSALVGSLQESFCIGMAGYFCFYYTLHYRELRGKTAWMVIGFCLGATACVLAPSNFVRLGATESKAVGLLKYIGGVMLVIINAKTYVLMFLSLVVLWCSKKHKLVTREILSTHALLITSASINALFVAVVAYTGSHQITGIELFSLIVLLSIAYELWIVSSPKAERIINYVSYTLVIALCIPLWQQRATISNAYKDYVRNASHPQNGIVVATDYMHELTLERGWLRANFVRSQESLSNTVWLSRYLTNGKNDSLFHTILPQTPEYIISACTETNRVGDGVYRPKDYNFYIFRCRSDRGACAKITRKVTLFGGIRNKIQTGSPYEVSNQKLSSMFHISSQDETYYIELDDQNYPIQDAKIINLHEASRK